jgi:L-ribulose-5-phosphate 4-epimerase
MFEELRERVVAANLALVDAGLVVLTFGNASAADRDAGVMAIKPSGVAYAELAPADVPVLEIATGMVVFGGSRPSSDKPTHLAL